MPAGKSMVHSVVSLWGDLSDDEQLGNNLVADGWLFYNGKLMLYKFECSQKPEEIRIDPSKHDAFLQEFKGLLTEHGFKGHSVSTPFPWDLISPGCVEIIQGDLLINFLAGQVS